MDNSREPQKPLEQVIGWVYWVPNSCVEVITPGSQNVAGCGVSPLKKWWTLLPCDRVLQEEVIWTQTCTENDHMGKTAVYMPRRNPTLQTLVSDFQPLDYETVNVCCVNPPVCGTLLHSSLSWLILRASVSDHGESARGSGLRRIHTPLPFTSSWEPFQPPLGSALCPPGSVP